MLSWLGLGSEVQNNCLVCGIVCQVGFKKFVHFRAAPFGVFVFSGGEVMVALHNHSNAERRIACGERIAQLVVAPFLKAEFEETDELSDTVRGAGGFGSTGKV